MTDIDLKKIEKKVYFIVLMATVLFTIGSLDKLTSGKFFSVPGYILWIVIVLILMFLLFLWFNRMERFQKAGKETSGLRFFRLLHRYRFLMEQLIARDFKIKYKRSVLGVFWSFLNPLLMMSVQYVVFSHILNVRGDVQHYAIYLLCGIVVWNGFNDSVTQAMRSITSNAPLITKVYVPKYIYPITKVLSASINTLLSMVPLLLVTIIYGLFSNPHLYLHLSIFLLPFGLLFLIIFCLGIGFVLSSLMVFFHDMEFLWTVFSTIWMYATPIIYSLSMFESKAHWLVELLKWNPMYQYVNFIRTIIIDGAVPSLTNFGMCIGYAALSLLLGSLVFKKCQDRFILYL